MGKGKHTFEQGPRNDEWSEKFRPGQRFKIKGEAVEVITIKKLRKEIHLKVVKVPKKKKVSAINEEVQQEAKKKYIEAEGDV